MSKISILHVLRERVCSFGSDRRGNVAIIFGLAMLPIIGLVGAAVDYSRGNAAKASMQAALDAAALTLSKEARGMTDAQLSAKAHTYFLANYNRPGTKNIKITPTFNDLGNGSFKLNLLGQATIDTTLIALWQDQMSIGADSQVIWGYRKLELALALDNTGSMQSSNKMTHLKSAAKNLLTTLKGAAKKHGDVKVAIIPFDTTVNLGTSYKDNDWFDIDSLDCNGWKSGSGCSKANWKNYWEGCVRDRTYPYDTTDEAPTKDQTKFPVHDCGSLAKLMPLTTDWTSLNNKVDEMHAERHDQRDHRPGLGVARVVADGSVDPGFGAEDRSRQDRHPADRRRQHRVLEEPEQLHGHHAEPDRRAHQARLRQRQAGRHQALYDPRDRR